MLPLQCTRTRARFVASTRTKDRVDSHRSLQRGVPRLGDALYLFIASSLTGCVGHITSAVARSDRAVTYVQRAVEYHASDTLVDCRFLPSGDRVCDVIRLDGEQ